MYVSQEEIIVSNRLVASMKVGIKKEAAKLALVKFKKNDELMRKRLFILQVKSNMVLVVADKLSKTKAGEFLDSYLNKILEEENKMKRKLQLELKKGREKYRITAKRAKAYPPRSTEFDAGPSSTGGYHGASRGRGGYSRGGGMKNIPTESRGCYVCKSTEHLTRNCTDDKKEFIDATFVDEQKITQPSVVRVSPMLHP